MILVIGRFDTDDLLLRQNLYNFYAELIRSSNLDACLILHPGNTADTSWLQPMLFSLRSAGVKRVNIVIPTSVFPTVDLLLLERSGVTEVILLEDSFGAHFIDSETIGVRVWLTGIDTGHNHQKICTWNSFVSNLLSIEALPFQFPEFKWLAHAGNTHSSADSTSCHPENAIFLVGDTRSIFPDQVQDQDGRPPAKAPFGAPGACSLSTRIQSWKSKLPLKGICRDCSAWALIEIPAWLYTPDHRQRTVSGAKFFFDHVKGDLTKMSPQQKVSMKNDFLERVKMNAINQAP